MGTPTLVIVSGPPGAGKTTLAHRLARAIGCPAICRDEIKEGMVHASPGFTPSRIDPLSLRTFEVFAHTLRSMVENEVTTVAEAAFQHHLWCQALDPLREQARIRVVQCEVDHATAQARQQVRLESVAARAAHADAAQLDATRPGEFDYLRLDAPTLRVATTDGYEPGLDAIVRFVVVPG